MRILDKPTLEEVENLAAEADLFAENRLAHAAELIALRRLHAIAAREHRGSQRFIRILSGLPGVGDVATWKKIVDESKAARAATEPGAPGARDLAQQMEEKA